MNQASIPSGCSFSQAMVDQRPKFDSGARKKKRKSGSNQVLGKGGLLRPDKRKKAHFL